MKTVYTYIIMTVTLFSTYLWGEDMAYEKLFSARYQFESSSRVLMALELNGETRPVEYHKEGPVIGGRSPEARMLTLSSFQVLPDREDVQARVIISKVLHEDGRLWDLSVNTKVGAGENEALFSNVTQFVGKWLSREEGEVMWHENSGRSIEITREVPGITVLRIPLVDGPQGSLQSFVCIIMRKGAETEGVVRGLSKNDFTVSFDVANERKEAVE